MLKKTFKIYEYISVVYCYIAIYLPLEQRRNNMTNWQRGK